MNRVLIILMASLTVWSCGNHARCYHVRPADGDCTLMIQNKLDRCYAAGGGKVVLHPGEYHIGGLRLRSNTTLYLKSGVRLTCSRDCDDYNVMYDDKYVQLDQEDNCGRDLVWVSPQKRTYGPSVLGSCAGSRWNDGIIRIYKEHDVAIIGEEGSVIDGCNSYFPDGEEYYRGVHGISVHKSTNLTFKGYTIQRTGNWAHNLRKCTNVVFEDLTILGGHDGIHVSSCDSVRITGCTIKTGDDCVAGFDNQHVVVKACTLNTACSAFRFGGTDFLAEDCVCYGPGEYIFRGSLTKEEKEAGADTGVNARRNTLSFFTYYADRSIKIRENPGNMRFRNIECHNIDRFIHYNLSGSETWQLDVPLEDVSFENVSIANLKYPLCLYGTEDCPAHLVMKGCRLSFMEGVNEFIRGAWIGLLHFENVSISGLDEGVPMIRNWAGNMPETNISGLTGVNPEMVTETSAFSVQKN